MIVIEQFLSDFDKFRQHAISRSFHGEVNPFDGVTYPDISADIPEETSLEIKEKLSSALGKKIDIVLMFMRLMSKNTSTPPHQAHNDAIMGQYTGILYINDGDGCTSFIDHKDICMMYGPEDEYQQGIWLRDTNKYDAWRVVDMIHVKQNRMVIFNSNVMHRAEPVKGFGDCPENGRLVLTVFFNAL